MPESRLISWGMETHIQGAYSRLCQENLKKNSIISCPKRGWEWYGETIGFSGKTLKQEKGEIYYDDLQEMVVVFCDFVCIFFYNSG